MITDEERIKRKSDNELVYISVHAKNYKADFIALVDAELVRRGITIDNLEEKRATAKPHSSSVKEPAKWLVGFAVILAIIRTLYGFFHIN